MVKIVNRGDITPLPGKIGSRIKGAEKDVSRRLDALGLVGNKLELQREAYRLRCAELLREKSAERQECEDSLYHFLETAWPSMERNPFCPGFHLEAVCEHLQAVSSGEINRLLINIPPRTGKPIHIDELVYTKRGFVRLGDIVIGDMVLTHKGRFRRVLEVHEQGIIPTITVNTNCGRSVRAAPDHPFLTTRGWINAGDLIAGKDFVGIPRRIDDIEIESSISPEEARFLGYLIGDGGISQRTLRFTNADEDILCDFIHCAKACGFYAYIWDGGNKALKAKTVILKSTEGRWSSKTEPPIFDWLRKHGLYLCNSYTKRIPLAVLASNSKIVENFIGAYWSCDGTISIRHSSVRDTMISSATTVGKNLSEDILRAMSILNIHCRIRTKDISLESKKQPGGKYRSYNIQTTERNEVAKFSGMAGLCERKSKIASESFFDRFEPNLYTDEVISITSAENGTCRCLTVDEDSSFTVNGLAVHNTNAVSIAWPAWTWAQQEITDLTGPQTQFLCASYGHTLALDISNKCRHLIDSDFYQKYWGDRFSLRADQNTKSRFDTSEGGSRIATSVGGALTGLGADIIICLPYESMILSDRGWIQIGDIVENKILTKIAGWNGNEIVWQNIQVYEKNPFRRFYEVDFGDGKICCTEDHLVFTSRGYIPAKDIIPGDEIWSYDLETVSRMRAHDVSETKQEQREILLSSMQYAGKDSKCFNSEQSPMRKMRNKSLPATSTFVSQNTGSNILQSDLLWEKIQRIKKSSVYRWLKSKMQTMFTGFYQASTQHSILFSKMFWSCEQIAIQRMPILRKIIQAIHNKNILLFSKMRRYDAFRTHEGLRKRTLCSWSGSETLSSRMDKIAQTGRYTPGSFSMHAMWDASERAQWLSACSSHKLYEGKFRSDESDNALSILSREDAWGNGTKKELVRKIVISSKSIDRKEEFTYNIRVDPCHNYFADGILVHNCDDAHNAQEIESELTIRAAVRWFSEGLQSRLNNPKTGAIVVIMQRLSDEDLSGYILSKESGYTHLNLPLEYESTRHCITNIGWTDPRTEEGELLCPARIGEDEVVTLKKALGSYAYSGQYQQSPTPRGGGIIKDKWWKLYPEQGELMDEYGKPVTPLEYPPMEFVIAFADTAYTTKEENDYSALTIWGVWRKDGAPKVMLMGAWKERLELNELVNKINKSCSAQGGIPVDRLLIENKASGKSVGQELIRLFDGSQFGIEMVEPKGDKLSRMYSVQHLFENGIVYAPDRTWAQMVIDDVSKFPKGAHDDIPDTVSGALRYLRDSNFALRSDEHDTEQMEQDMYRKPSGPLYDV